MSKYELFFLGGAAMIALAIMMFFASATKDGPIQKSIAIFAFGGVLLFLADQNTPQGIDPGDLPGIIYKFVLTFF